MVTNTSDALTYMARSGHLRLTQMAFAYCFCYWQETGRPPDPATVPAAVQRKWGKRMSLRTAYAGVKCFEEALQKEKVA